MPRTIAFDDWRRGHHGDLDPRLAPQGSWHGLNMVVTEDGLICPRPGLKAATTSGATLPAAGDVWGVHYQPVTARELIVVAGDTVFYATNDTDENLDFTEIDQLDAEPTDICRFEFVDPLHVYMVSPGEGLYHIDLEGTVSLTKITFDDDVLVPVPAGYCLRVFGNRLYVGGDEDGTDPDVVRYSDASDFDVFQTTSAFQVGVHFPAFTMQVVRGRLLIGGRGGGWYSLTDAVDAGGALRRVGSIVSYWGQSGDRPMMQTNGATFDEFGFGSGLPAHLRIGGTVHGDFSYANRDIIFHSTSTREGVWRSHGAWCAITMPEPGDTISGPMTRFATDRYLFATFIDDTIGFAWLQAGLNRPGRPDDPYGDIADLGDEDPLPASLTTPEVATEKSETLQVRAVIVCFDGFNYDSNPGGEDDTGLECSFTVEVNVHDREGNAPAEVKTDAFALSTAEFDTAGSGRRWSMTGGRGWGTSFKVKVTDIVGVKLDRILVVVETRAEEGHA
jgi:hypothetical protein